MLRAYASGANLVAMSKGLWPGFDPAKELF